MEYSKKLVGGEMEYTKRGKIFRVEGELVQEYLNEKIVQYLLKEFDDTIEVKEIKYKEEAEGDLAETPYFI